jgi:hypothetical protein
MVTILGIIDSPDFELFANLFSMLMSVALGSFNVHSRRRSGRSFAVVAWPEGESQSLDDTGASFVLQLCAWRTSQTSAPDQGLCVGEWDAAAEHGHSAMGH